MSRNYVKTNTTYQMEATECGAASLSMILDYFGCYVPLEKLRIETGVSRNGVNAKNIYECATRYGLKVKAYTRSAEKLLELKPPCILHWNFNHFLVYEGFKNNKIYLNDPAQGKRKLTMEEFEQCFTGIVLTFEKGEDFKSIPKEKNHAKLAIKRIKQEKTPLIAISLFSLILVIPGLLAPIFSAVFIDNILIGGMRDWLKFLLLAMGFTLLFNFVFSMLRAKVIEELEEKVYLISSYKFLSRMFSLSPSFFQQRYVGDLANRIENNNNVNKFLLGELAISVSDLFVAIFYLILMFVYNIKMTLIALFFTLISVLYAVISSKKLDTYSTKNSNDIGRYMGIAYSGLSIRDTLKAAGCENDYSSRTMGYFANSALSQQKIGKTAQILSTIPSAIMQVTNVVIIIVGGVLVMRENLTAGMLVAFMQLLSGFVTPVNSTIGLFQKIQTLKADMNRVEDIEKYPVEKQTHDNTSSYEDKLSGLVELKDITFGYSALEEPLLQGFNFKLYPGESIALVGSSGCGKSTVAKLVSGLNKPWKGEVLLDNMNRDIINEDLLSSSVSIVSQDIFMFQGSIRDNLTMWNQYTLEEDIINACKDACIHDLITKLPGAYSYELREGASNLSGGEKQRLEIARALVTNPSILILDEATSALDPVVEKKVMNNIKRRGCSLIIVAHRLSTIRDANNIIVMKDGKIIEQGTHDELSSRDSVYANLIKNN